MNQGQSYKFAAVVPTVLAAGITPSRCTMQLPDGTLTAGGQPSGNWVDIAGLVSLVVMNAPATAGKLTSAEMKAEADIQAFSPRHVWIAGYYPAIDPLPGKGARAVIDGTPYDLLGAESDSQMYTTRISIRTSTV
jgi:hypothetical protein